MPGFSWFKKKIFILKVETPYEYDKISSDKNSKNVELTINDRIYRFEDSFTDGEKPPKKKDYLGFVKAYEEQLMSLPKTQEKILRELFPAMGFPEGKRIFSNTHLGAHKPEDAPGIIAHNRFDSDYAINKHAFVAKDYGAPEHSRMKGKIHGEQGHEIGFQFTGEIDGNSPKACLGFLQQFHDTFPLADHAGKQFSIEGTVPEATRKTALPLQSFMNEQLAKYGLGMIEGHAASVTRDENSSDGAAHIGTLHSRDGGIDFHFPSQTFDKSSTLESSSKACMDFMRNFGASVDLQDFHGQRLDISLTDTLENNLVKNGFDGHPIKVEEKLGANGKEHIASLNVGEHGEKIDFCFAPTPRFGLHHQENSSQDCRRFMREFQDAYDGSLPQLAGKTYTITEFIPQGPLEHFVQRVHTDSLKSNPLDPKDVAIQETMGANGKEHIASLNVGEHGEKVHFHFVPDPPDPSRLLVPNSTQDCHRFISGFRKEVGQSAFLYADKQYSILGRIPPDRTLMDFVKRNIEAHGLPAAAPSTLLGPKEQQPNSRTPSSDHSTR